MKEKALSNAIKLLNGIKDKRIFELSENLDNFTDILSSEDITSLDEVINSLMLLKSEIKREEKQTWLFTFDYSNLSGKGYSDIKKYFTSNGFKATGDSDYISKNKISEKEFRKICDGLFDTLPWMVNARKAYGTSIVNSVQDMLEEQRARLGDKIVKQEKAPTVNKNPKSRAVTVHGKEYKNIIAVAEDYGFKSYHIYDMKHDYPEKNYEEIVDMLLEQRRIKEESLTIDGHKFSGVADIAKYLHIAYGTLINYVNENNCSYKEAAKHFQESKGKGFANKSQSCVVNGKEYPSILSAVKAYNVEYISVINLTKNKNFSVESAINSLLNNEKTQNGLGRQTIINGVIYPSMKEAIVAQGFNVGTVKSYMKNNGVSIEEAIQYYIDKKAAKEAIMAEKDEEDIER